MINPLTPESDPQDIAAVTELLPKLASLLNTDPKAKQLLEDAGQGKIDELELMMQLAIRLELAETSEQ